MKRTILAVTAVMFVSFGSLQAAPAQTVQEMWRANRNPGAVAKQLAERQRQQSSFDRPHVHHRHDHHDDHVHRNHHHQRNNYNFNFYNDSYYNGPRYYAPAPYYGPVFAPAGAYGYRAW